MLELPVAEELLVELRKGKGEPCDTHMYCIVVRKEEGFDHWIDFKDMQRIWIN